MTGLSQRDEKTDESPRCQFQLHDQEGVGRGRQQDDSGATTATLTCCFPSQVKCPSVNFFLTVKIRRLSVRVSAPSSRAPNQYVWEVNKSEKPVRERKAQYPAKTRTRSFTANLTLQVQERGATTNKPPVKGRENRLQQSSIIAAAVGNLLICWEQFGEVHHLHLLTL